VSRIGRYEVETEIGRGAMGVVYLAHDPRLRRRVAVKTYALPQGLSEGQEAEFRERFLREAQAAAGLSHPGIVTVYDADEDSHADVPYIAMEYVPGQSLQQILRAEGSFTLDRVAAIVERLAGALQVAHDAGVVHRDIKPANVIVHESTGGAKLADFGVARLSSSTLTQSGTSLGSPAYMSPEQARGQTTDGRSDLFSLAVILYELLCGTRPFTGEDPTAVLYSIVHETALPITKRRKGLPARLDGFFATALAKQPADRFADGTSFKRAFEEAIGEPSADDPEATVQQPLRAPESIASLGTGTTDPAAPWLESRKDRPRRRRALLLVCGALCILALVGWAVLGGKKAYLKLDVKSGVESGRLTLLVDGEEVLRRELSAPRTGQGFIKKMLDKDLETFEAWIETSPGKHEVAAHIERLDGTSAYRDTVVVDLEPGETRRLKLSAERKYGSALSLKAD
jgi:serine/threonine protein kinase